MLKFVKNALKICIYQKFFVPLHCQTKTRDTDGANT